MKALELTKWLPVRSGGMMDVLDLKSGVNYCCGWAVEARENVRNRE